jgi:Dolichyl-phosphate-mannose-protein mannosyltransferase
MNGRVAPVVAAAVAIALGGFAVVKGTWAVGGSDSSCYGLMADAFSHFQLQPTSALAIEAPWPDASRTVAPAGFIPSPVRSDAASPVCAPGFSMLMAPLEMLAGRDGVFWLTPLAAAALVWLTFLLGQRLAGGMAGVVAAVLTASSPIVLYQAVQPMNDITCAALWLAAVVAATSESPRRSWWAGLFSGVAILVRPNLAPLAIITMLACGWRLKSIAQFCVASLPGFAALLGLNAMLYGSPLSSGYGDPNQLFSVSFAAQNLRNYGRSIYETQNVFPALGLAAPFVFAGAARRLSLFALAASATVFAAYLFYWPFPEWSYLRFLLPGLVLLIALASAVAVRVALNARMGGVIAVAAVILALAGFRIARDRQAFDLQRLESRFRDMGNLVASRLPDRAVLITVWESGSVRFHAGHEVVLWDSLDPDWLDRAVSWLNDRGRPTFILVERREENEFRSRFRGRSVFGGLDWPPRFDLNRQARIFDTADRARHRDGESYPTENVRPTVR